MPKKNNHNAIRKGDPLEDAFEEFFPKFLQKAGFEVCKIHRVTSRTNDITDFDHIEFKHNYVEEEEKDGIIIKTAKSRRYFWAVECKGRESKTKYKVTHNELSSKAIGIQKDLKDTETWIIFAPERPLDDKSYKYFGEGLDDLNFRFHIEIWDDNNLEFRKVFSTLDDKVWNKFFLDTPYSESGVSEVHEYIKEISEKGKNRKQSFENKLAGKTDSKESVTIAGKFGGVSKRFTSIHLFLDHLNNLLDKDFEIVKRIYYPDTWKLGLAYYQYKDDELSYTLYPIPSISNDVQIKEVDINLRDKIKNDGLGFTGHFSENPIEKRPVEYAKELIESKVLKIVENKLLNHSGTSFLVNEFIFAFIDKFHEQMGLPVKDSYSPKEIEKGFYEHLPFWLIEAYKILKNRNSLPRKNYLDPDSISFLKDGERSEIAELVSSLILTSTQIPQIPIGNSDLPFGIFVEFFNYVKQEGKDIQRKYVQKDFSRLSGKTAWVWSVFSEKDANTNLQTFFKYLPQMYEQLIANNFPNIEKDLSFFGEATTIAIAWTVRDEYQGFESGPLYSMYHLVSKNEQSQKIIFDLTVDESLLLANIDFKSPEITLRGEKYRLISFTNSHLDFLYESTPMLNFIYKTLNARLKNYFRK